MTDGKKIQKLRTNVKKIKKKKKKKIKKNLQNDGA